MTYEVNDIEQLAQANSKLDGITFPPDDMPELEKVLYWQLFNLYKLYLAKAVDKEHAKLMKSHYITEFGRADLKRDIYGQAHKRRAHINAALKKGIDSGCEHCRKVQDLLDGRLDSRLGEVHHGTG